MEKAQKKNHPDDDLFLRYKGEIIRQNGDDKLRDPEFIDKMETEYGQVAKELTHRMAGVLGEEFFIHLKIKFSAEDTGEIKKSVIDYLAARFSEEKHSGDQTPAEWLEKVKNFEELRKRVADKEDKIAASEDYEALSVMSGEEKEKRIAVYETLAGLKTDKFFSGGKKLKLLRGLGAKSHPTSAVRKWTDILRSKEERDALDIYFSKHDEVEGGMGREIADLDTVERDLETLKNIHDVAELRALRAEILNTFSVITNVHNKVALWFGETLSGIEARGGKDRERIVKYQAQIDELNKVRSLQKKGVFFTGNPLDLEDQVGAMQVIDEGINETTGKIKKLLEKEVKDEITQFKYYESRDASKTFKGEMSRVLSHYFKPERRIGNLNTEQKLAFFAELFKDLSKDKDVVNSQSGKEKIALLQEAYVRLEDDVEAMRSKKAKK